MQEVLFGSRNDVVERRSKQVEWIEDLFQYYLGGYLWAEDVLKLSANLKQAIEFHI